jgi:hypothetical protein
LCSSHRLPKFIFCLENSAVSKSPFAAPILAHIPMLVQICEIEPIDFSVNCFTEKKFAWPLKKKMMKNRRKEVSQPS